MGCRKLSYYEEQEALEKSPLKILGAPEEKIQSVIFCDSYTPFGLQMAGGYQRSTALENKFLFGGKEMQTDLDLNWGDFGARMYMADIGRWGVVDPLADKWVDYSPYNYVLNNPANLIDPDGRSPITPMLRYLAKKGVKWAARTAKGKIKGVSRKQANKLLKSKQTVYKVEKGGSKKAKRLMEEAAPTKKIVKHKGHNLKNGKKGMDHYQPKDGGGAHVNVENAATAAAVTTNGTSNESSTESAGTDTVDAAVDAVMNGSPAAQQITAGANAGKALFGDNAVGNFIDNWVNPMGLAKDVAELAVIGTIAVSQPKKEEKKKEEND